VIVDRILYEDNNLDVRSDLPAPAVPATKIAFTHWQNDFSHNNLDLFGILKLS